MTESGEEINAVHIVLSDESILVDGETASVDKTAAVYTANDIIYYETGKDFTYGEGEAEDEHTAEEAAAHRVVHIAKPGTYVLSGTLSAGQVAVDLGEGAEEDPNAVVTLILDGVDITCSVAPAVIFYNVYECGSADPETAAKDVDTSAAGANVVIADGTNNYINGSYVARIYKPETVELNEEGTEVLDVKKLHKYDAAFYSKMSMNIDGGERGDGLLAIRAENEGLDSELHLTINGGEISILSGNDGINTNEDGVSVTTVNGGFLSILVTGETGEGDGIDSNGWLVVNGGTVVAGACENSMDAGIDSDMGIHINGGVVMATGYMLDRIEDGGQTYAVFQFQKKQSGEEDIVLKNSMGEEVMGLMPRNDYSVLIYSSPELTEGDYTLWIGDAQCSGSSGNRIGGFGMDGGIWLEGMEPGGPRVPPELEGLNVTELPQYPVEGGGRGPGVFEPPEGMERPGGNFIPQMNEKGTMTLPDGTVMDPVDMVPPGGMNGGMPGRFDGTGGQISKDISEIFEILNGGNVFYVVTDKG